MKIAQDKPLDPSYTVILFYKYAPITNLEECMAWQRELGNTFRLTGRVRLASEGINATLEGKNENIALYIEELRKFPGFENIEIKTSVGTGFAFMKLSVKIVPEIVKLGLGKEYDIDPNQITGTHLKPEELKHWYDNNEDFVVVDMRNDYEFRVGHFKNSINPPITNFREIADVLPDIIKENPGIQNKKVITVCTGGVRCEKASGYLKTKGFTDVYQLDGGMHMYMEKFPGQDFKGGLFTFDNRVVMDFTKDREVIGKCDLCSKATERFDNCINDECHIHMVVCQECRDEREFVWCSDECRETGRLGKVRFRDMDLKVVN
ncbi:MAG: rhodanese-related sulfurtransferase [Patescibacteria group bacterium]